MNKDIFKDSKTNEKENNINTNDENNKEEDKESTNNNEEINNQTITTLNKAPMNNGEYQHLGDGEYLTEKGYTLKVENGITTIDGILIANKTYSLPASYGGPLTNEVMNAFNLMKADATSIGLNIWIQSGYRSYARQEGIYNNYVARDGQIAADTYSARPGHSEHQTGLCFDLNTIDDSFTYTNEGRWINENCYRYGFIIRYPKGKDNITGYMHESWHLRYVGVDLATTLYNNGEWITIEEYYGISSSY